MQRLLSLWDSVSFLIVFGGSALVWLIRFVCKRKWSFFSKNISIFLVVAYSMVWSVQLVFSGNTALVFSLAMIPFLYGIILELVFNWIYRRQHNADNID